MEGDNTIQTWRTERRERHYNQKQKVPCPLATTVKKCGPACPGCPHPDEYRREREKAKLERKQRRERRRSASRQRSKKRRKLTYREIGKSAGNNCCACIQTLTAYFKEVFKLVWCVTGSASPGYETRLDQLFCDMLEIVGCLGQDFCNLIRRVMRCGKKRFI